MTGSNLFEIVRGKALPAILIVGMLSAASIGQQTVREQRRQNVNWEQQCIQYGGLVHTPCNELVACLFGGGTLLLLGADPTIVAMIGKAMRGACP